MISSLLNKIFCVTSKQSNAIKDHTIPFYFIILMIAQNAKKHKIFLQNNYENFKFDAKSFVAQNFFRHNEAFFILRVHHFFENICRRVKILHEARKETVLKRAVAQFKGQIALIADFLQRFHQ